MPKRTRSPDPRGRSTATNSPKPNSKSPRNNNNKLQSPKKAMKSPNNNFLADDVSSSDNDSDDDQAGYDMSGNVSDSSDDDNKETYEQRKVRVANEYIESVRAGVANRPDGSSSGDSSSDEDGYDENNRMGDVMRIERQKITGKYTTKIATKISNRLMKTSTSSDGYDSSITLIKSHHLSLTSCCLSKDGPKTAYSASKDTSLYSYDLNTLQKSAIIPIPSWKKKGGNQNDQILCLESVGGWGVLAGSRDGRVRVFDCRLNGGGGYPVPLNLTGHKDAITGLTIRRGTNELYSCSADRCVRRWDFSQWLSVLSSPPQESDPNQQQQQQQQQQLPIRYIETLYGHQSGVSGISSYYRPSIFTVGRDRTARSWKVNEDSHFIFRPGASSQPLSTVSAVNDEWFLTGGEDGKVGLWYGEKKKAVAEVAESHGNKNDGIGIVSSATLKGSDFAMTGSNDGGINLWECRTGAINSERGMEQIGRLNCKGYVNAIDIGGEEGGEIAVCALGQEHKLGRWDVAGGKKLNRFAIVRLGGDDDEDEDEGEDEDEDDVNDVVDDEDNENYNENYNDDDDDDDDDE